MSFKSFLSSLTGPGLEEQKKALQQEREAFEAEKKEQEALLDQKIAAASGKMPHPCVALVNIDNYDDLLASAAPEEQAHVTAEIDRIVRTWGQSLSAAVARVRSSAYLLTFDGSKIQALKESKFPVIDEVHDIQIEGDFPTSISIGIGTGAEALDQQQDLAEDALELALGRGGDQAVIKSLNGDVLYFGGTLVSVERRNKGRSRIMAHALLQHIKNCDRLFICGHVRPDLDCIGAGIGVSAYANAEGVENYIIVNEVGDAIDLMYDEAKKTGKYKFITSLEALDMATEKSLLVVVDTHLPYLVECPELVGRLKNKVLIDHHRRSKDAIDDAVLNFMEPYASSASELVSEMLSYTGHEYDKFTLDALLAGIALDSKNFTIGTGIRTFEAAAWLKREGADTKSVQNYFKMRLDFYKKKVNIIASAEYMGNGVAVAYTKEEDPSMQVLVAQAADELLNMREITTAFVAGRGEHATLVSARSSGNINVQTFMERLGGGGHHGMAAAQLSDASPEEAIANIVNQLREDKIL